jgi:hydroxymethylglutaryl-CoA lyase
MSTKDRVRIFEVGPRDGLQNEKRTLSLPDRLWLVESLSKAGLSGIEAGAFVRPDKIPQMAESELIEPALQSKNLKASRWYLVPNRKGLERAIAAQVKNIAVFTAVSNTFNKNNIGMMVEESFVEIEALVKEAKAEGMNIRGYVSTVWGCPFEGKISPAQALPVLERMLALPIDELSVGDTIGVAAPAGVEAIFKPLIEKYPAHKLAAHFHDTRGTALANALRAFELGVRTFDSSVGGLGGCPFAPGASGNLATEDLAYLFKEMGLDTGIDYQALCETSLELSKRMGDRPLQSRALLAYQTNCAAKNEWDI